MMGFPSRTVESFPSLCACHSKPSCGGYLCSRCGNKVCGLPAECPSCGLTLILSTHLARSYHHLFPLINWVEVPWKRALRSTHCFACGIQFPTVPPTNQWGASENQVKGMSVSSRYECPACQNHFCIDCDLFAHEVVHNCPGCQSTNLMKPHHNGDASSPPVERMEGITSWAWELASTPCTIPQSLCRNDSICISTTRWPWNDFQADTQRGFDTHATILEIISEMDHALCAAGSDILTDIQPSKMNQRCHNANDSIQARSTQYQTRNTCIYASLKTQSYTYRTICGRVLHHRSTAQSLVFCLQT
jgi:transcription factor Ssl1